MRNTNGRSARKAVISMTKCVCTHSVFMLRKHEHNKKVPIGFYCFRLVHYDNTCRYKKNIHSHQMLNLSTYILYRTVCKMIMRFIYYMCVYISLPVTYTFFEGCCLRLICITEHPFHVCTYNMYLHQSC